MSDLSIVEVTPTQADYDAAKPFFNEGGPAYPLLVQAFARHRASEAERVREEAAAMLEHAVGEGYPTPKNKVDTCEHGKYGWEDCIACYDERLFEVAAAMLVATINPSRQREADNRRKGYLPPLQPYAATNPALPDNLLRCKRRVIGCGWIQALIGVVSRKPIGSTRKHACFGSSANIPMHHRIST